MKEAVIGLVPLPFLLVSPGFHAAFHRWRGWLRMPAAKTGRLGPTSNHELENFSFLVHGDGSCKLREPVCFICQVRGRTGCEGFSAMLADSVPSTAPRTRWCSQIGAMPGLACLSLRPAWSVPSVQFLLGPQWRTVPVPLLPQGFSFS